VVRVQTHRELLEHGVQGVSRDTFDYQLPARDSDRQRLAISDEECSESVGDSIHSSVQKRVALRVDHVLVQRDRKLDEKIGKLARQRGNRRPGSVRGWRDRTA
jgi:hypothetical protein